MLTGASRPRSFNEKNVAKLLGRIEAKLNSSAKLTHEQRAGYEAVKDLLITKQVMGGSSLKKLQVILDTQHEGRLYDQYLHCGAGQSLRTTGRSVQMQNLKRLAETPDVSVLHDQSIHWDNEKLAENIRQVFTASNPTGKLIVGDFSSVESRGLAWLAYENWKLDAYRKGQDLYKVLATKIYGVPYDQITKEQRMTGKVGELSCGYGAGPAAVIDFAEGMGVQLNTAEATKLVWDWRDANPRIVDLWDQLNTMLHAVVESGRGHVKWELNDGLYLRFSADTPPSSLTKINPNSVTVCMQIVDSDDHHTVLARYFHGCHRRGRNIVLLQAKRVEVG